MLAKPMLLGAAMAATLAVAPVMAQDMNRDMMNQGSVGARGSMGTQDGMGQGVTMTDPVSTNWADNWSVNSSQSPMGATGMPQNTYGQGTYGSTGAMDQGMMGSGSSGAGGQTGRVMMDVRNDNSLQARRGRGQNMTELTQTSLLNSFSSAGFMGVRNFHKDGDRYLAEAQQRDGSWAMVEMDPRTGTIRSIR